MPMSIEQIVAEEQVNHAAWEAKTVATKVLGKDVTIAELRYIFELVEDKANWKNPINVCVHHNYVAITAAAIEYFHGVKPEIVGPMSLTGKILVSSPGYQG
jgi:hypothetical protein